MKNIKNIKNINNSKMRKKNKSREVVPPPMCNTFGQHLRT